MVLTVPKRLAKAVSSDLHEAVVVDDVIVDGVAIVERAYCVAVTSLLHSVEAVVAIECSLSFQ